MSDHPEQADLESLLDGLGEAGVEFIVVGGAAAVLLGAPVTTQDLDMFRDLLMEKRAEILGDVAAMEEARNDNSGGNLSHMPLHMADIGSDNYEQEFTLGLMESEKRLLREIDEALLRIRDGIYGVCLESGKPIIRARLEIKPWAKYSIEVARERERRGL